MAFGNGGTSVDPYYPHSTPNSTGTNAHNPNIYKIVDDPSVLNRSIT